MENHSENNQTFENFSVEYHENFVLLRLQTPPFLNSTMKTDWNYSARPEIDTYTIQTLLLMLIYLVALPACAIIFACILKFLRRHQCISSESAYHLLNQCHQLLNILMHQQQKFNHSCQYSPSPTSSNNNSELINNGNVRNIIDIEAV